MPSHSAAFVSTAQGPGVSPRIPRHRIPSPSMTIAVPEAQGLHLEYTIQSGGHSGYLTGAGWNVEQSSDCNSQSEHDDCVPGRTGPICADPAFGNKQLEPWGVPHLGPERHVGQHQFRF